MLPGLIDVEKLRCDGKKSGLESGKSGAGRGHVGEKSGSGRGAAEPVNTGILNGFGSIPANGAPAGAELH